LKIELLGYLMTEIKKIIPEVSVRIYGSFITGISLEESDIDLVLFHCK